MKFNIFKKKPKKVASSATHRKSGEQEKKIEKPIEENKKQLDEFKKEKKEKIIPSPILESQSKKFEVTPKNIKIAYKILIKPLITEKATNMQASGCYEFEVFPKANKISVNRAIQELYGVKPKKVHIINVKGKKVKYGKSSGRIKNKKKAIIFLKEGQKIEFIKK